jgi:hypothetical protein
MAEAEPVSASSLRIHVAGQADGTTRISLAGVLGEDAALHRLLTDLEGAVVLNLREVERLNSVGVHQWVRMMTQLLRDRSVAIEELSYPFVLQANRVANLFGHATVRSCVAPYFCPHCDAPVTSLVMAAELAQQPARVPERACPTCGDPLDFDELDSYFDFLRG